MKTLSEITKEALELSPPQQLNLARILLDLTDESGDCSPEAAAAWEDEILRRMREVKAGRAHSDSFENVFARLDERFGK